MLGLVNHFVLIWHYVAQCFSMVNYVRRMTAKKCCKYGDCVLFELLLPLLQHYLHFFMLLSIVFMCMVENVLLAAVIVECICICLCVTIM